MNKEPSLLKGGVVVDDRGYSIDASKLKALGWEPQMDWDEGMAHTVKWYQENEWWWRRIKTGEFLEFYRRQYANSLCLP